MSDVVRALVLKKYLIHVAIYDAEDVGVQILVVTDIRHKKVSHSSSTKRSATGVGVTNLKTDVSCYSNCGTHLTTP